MKITQFNLQTYQEQQIKRCACIGYFDGVHIGHQALISKVIELSAENGCRPTLISFDPDPWTILRQQHNLTHITPLSKRLKIIDALGINEVILLTFTKAFSLLSIEEFHNEVLQPLQIDTLVCGKDFRYAKAGKGNCETLKAAKMFHVEALTLLKDHQQKVSSTIIEKKLADGKISQCAQLMGRYYSVEGVVGRGKKIGHQLHFPTANVKVIDNYIIPKGGVYAGVVTHNKKRYFSMINIGHNPTCNYQKQTSIEAHLFNFNDDIYDKQIQCHFVTYLRPEQTFAHKEALQTQLKQDKIAALAALQNILEEYICD